MPCHWFEVKLGVPIGTGKLGNLHPLCLLAIGFFGLFDNFDPQGQLQTKFENGFCQFLLERAEDYSDYIEVLTNIIPSPVAARNVNKDVTFDPANFYNLNMPTAFSNHIMQIILEVCKRICESTTLDSLNGGVGFTGSMKTFWNTIQRDCTLIDEMRGVSLVQRTDLRKVQQFHKQNQSLHCLTVARGQWNLTVANIEVIKKNAVVGMLNQDGVDAYMKLFGVYPKPCEGLEQFDPTKHAQTIMGLAQTSSHFSWRQQIDGIILNYLKTKTPENPFSSEKERKVLDDCVKEVYTRYNRTPPKDLCKSIGVWMGKFRTKIRGKIGENTKRHASSQAEYQ